MLLLAACGEAPPGSAGEWPQWRGRRGDGLIPATGLPVRWSADSDNVRWRTALPGEGNSSPIAASGRVFVTAASAGADRVERAVLALDAGGGELLWRTVVATDPGEPRHVLNTYAAPTPATDGRAVFAFFGATLAAVELDGRLRWSRQVDPHYAELSHYGAASSPVLTADAVIAVRDREDAVHGSGWMAAFDKVTGEELWRRTWVDTCCSYTTPLVTHREGREEIVFAHAARVTAYDPATGETLWSQELRQNQPVTSPVLAGDLLAVFTGADRVRNGAVLRLAGSGAETRIEILWQTRQMIPQVSSPVLYDGLLYTVADNGVAVCWEPLTGEIRWRQRLSGRGYRPSLLAGDGKVYAFDSFGHASVIAAGPSFRLLAENDLGEPGNASPAWAEGCLLVRTAEHLYCIEAGEEETPAPAGG